MAIACAPSNIALIKYMGKDDPASNLPANSSLSLTLSGLHTVAEVVPVANGATRWVPELPRTLKGPGNTGFERARPAAVPELGAKGQERILAHLARVAEAAELTLGRFGLKANPVPSAFELRAANTFPESSGIASSASSFAAVTVATMAAMAEDLEAFDRAFERDDAFRRALARISRQGSGSSCRSFEGPWVLWEKENAAAIQARLPEMADVIILVAGERKSVSSSEAHLSVKTSPLWYGRTDRVAARMRALEAALGEGDIATISRVAWAEFWEMHSLFHTCAESFTYWQPGTLQVLQWLKPMMGREDSPIVTMDAGPNVHLIVPAVEAQRWILKLAQALPFEILADRQGTGADFKRSDR